MERSDNPGTMVQLARRSRISLRSSGLRQQTNKKGSGTPTDAFCLSRYRATRTDVATRSRFGRGSPVGVPPRLLLKRPNATAQLQLTRFLGRVGARDPDGSKDRAPFSRALPAPSCPSPASSNSQTGLNAGRAYLAEAAPARVASPRGSTASRSTFESALATASLDERDSLFISISVTIVKTDGLWSSYAAEWTLMRPGAAEKGRKATSSLFVAGTLSNMPGDWIIHDRRESDADCFRVPASVHDHFLEAAHLLSMGIALP